MASVQPKRDLISAPTGSIKPASILCCSITRAELAVRPMFRSISSRSATLPPVRPERCLPRTSRTILSTFARSRSELQLRLLPWTSIPDPPTFGCGLLSSARAFSRRASRRATTSSTHPRAALGRSRAEARGRYVKGVQRRQCWLCWLAWTESRLQSWTSAGFGQLHAQHAPLSSASCLP